MEVLFETGTQRFLLRFVNRNRDAAATDATAVATGSGTGRLRVAVVQLRRVQRFFGLQFRRQIVNGPRVSRHARDPFDGAHRIRTVQRAYRAPQTALGTRPFHGLRRARRPRQRRPLDRRRLGRGFHRRSDVHRGLLNSLRAPETARPFRQLGFPHDYRFDGRPERTRFSQSRGGDGRSNTAAVGVVTSTAVSSRDRLWRGFFGFEITRRSLLTERLGRHQTHRFLKTKTTTKKKKKT